MPIDDQFLSRSRFGAGAALQLLPLLALTLALLAAGVAVDVVVVPTAEPVVVAAVVIVVEVAVSLLDTELVVLDGLAIEVDEMASFATVSVDVDAL
jgi:hypothetical protein